MENVFIDSDGVEGQWRQCPNCRNQVNLHHKFCSECGTQIEDLLSSQMRTAELMPFESEISLQAAKYQAPPFNIVAMFPHHEVSRSLREMYFDLGFALLCDQKYDDVITAFRHALDEDGTTPDQTEIMLYLAYGYEMHGDKTEAFRDYLQAVLQAPPYISTVLPHVYDLLPQEIDLDLAGREVKEWAIAIEKEVTNVRARMHVAILLGQIAFYLGQYPLAVTYFQEAMQWEPKEAGAVGAALLLPERLPDWFKAPTKGDGSLAEYILAQLYDALGYPKEALLRVSHALELGMKGTSAYPETSALLLQAQLLEKIGYRVEAASRFYEAGRRFSWLNDLAKAIEYLTRAKMLNPQHVRIYWYLSNALRMSSYMPSELLYVNKEKIDRSLAIWEEGRKISLPEKSDSWTYAVRALINQSLALLSTKNQQRDSLFWGAIVYLECALLQFQKDPFRWALLGRYYRILNLEACALSATQKGLSYDDNDPTTLDERAAILANVGQFSEAERLIDKRRDLEPSLWADGVKASILVHTQRAREALDLTNNLIAVSRQEISYRRLRALCYQELGRPSDALKDYQFIWDNYNPADMNNISAFGWAAYKLGNIERAIEISSTLQDSFAQSQCSVLWNLGIFHLAKGDLTTAESYLRRGTEAAPNIRQLDDVISFDFSELEQNVRDKPYGPQACALLKQIKAQIGLRREQITSRSLSVEEELKQVISRLQLTIPGPEMVENQAWIAAQAGLARFYVESERYNDAEAIYRRLLTCTEQFPEVQRGLETVSAHLKESQPPVQ